MSAVSIDLRIADPAWDVLSEPEHAALRSLEAAEKELTETIEGEVAILLTDDGEMQRLNRDWRGKDKATDILSFPASESEPGFLGDLALGFGVCSRDASASGLTLEDHITHLLIHGFYHLLGHDHETDDEARVMEAMEVSALARLGLGDPYSRNS